MTFTYLYFHSLQIEVFGAVEVCFGPRFPVVDHDVVGLLVGDVTFVVLVLEVAVPKLFLRLVTLWRSDKNKIDNFKPLLLRTKTGGVTESNKRRYEEV